MKMIYVLLISLLMMATPAFAGDALEDFLDHVSIQARADRDGFSARLCAQFGVPEAQVRIVLEKVDNPADAFMIFELGRMSHRDRDTVIHVYREGKGRGWGALAKELGIKPGSAEFHALKNGNLRFDGHRVEGDGSGKDESKGKSKNKDKGKDKGKGHGK